MHPPSFEILIRRGDSSAVVETHPFPPGDYIVGCSNEADLQLVAEEVSRRHARLVLGDDGAFIEDIGSRNGTLIGGVKIEGLVPLLPEQEVRIGSLTLELRHIAAGAARTVVADGPSADSPPANNPPGRRESAYEIGPLVAKGGMGAVLSARDLAIQRRVAMKVMLKDGDVAGTARFLEEAQITGQLEHPNIVPVHELGFDAEGRPFYTMKLVRGTTLRAVLEALAAGVAGTVAKYPLPVLLTIFQKVCDALAFAHSRQVIHRDLKPDNIMLGDFGEVLVMDWGIAKLVARADAPQARDDEAILSTRSEDAGAQTLEGSVMGTACYMSPEQAMGEVSLLDARSDIYSLGAILYEILALHPPVQGARVGEILGKVRKGEIAPMRERGLHLPGARIPDSLRAVCLKALSHSPASRYQRVEDLQADLRAYQNGFATGAERAGIGRHALLFVRRNKVISAAAALVAILSIVFVVRLKMEKDRAEENFQFAGISERAAVRAKNDAEAAMKEAKIARSLAESKETEAKTALANMLEAQQKAKQSEADKNVAVTQAATDRRMTEKMKSERESETEAQRLEAQKGRREKLSNALNRGETEEGFLHVVNMMRYASAEEKPHLQRMAAILQRWQPHLVHDFPIATTLSNDREAQSGGAITANGRYVILQTDNGVLTRYNMQNGAIAGGPINLNGSLRRISHSGPKHLLLQVIGALTLPDGKSTVPGAKSSLRLLDTEAWQLGGELPVTSGTTPNSARLLPGASQIISLNGATVQIWDAGQQTRGQNEASLGSQTALLATGGRADAKTAVALLEGLAQGNRATALLAGRLGGPWRPKVFQAADFQVPEVLRAGTSPPAGASRVFSFSPVRLDPAGMTVFAANSSDGRSAAFFRLDASLALAKPIAQRTFSAVIYGAAFSPDGRFLAVGSGSYVFLCDGQDMEPGPRLLGTDCALVREFRFSPDGRWLAAIGLSAGKVPDVPNDSDRLLLDASEPFAPRVWLWPLSAIQVSRDATLPAMISLPHEGRVRDVQFSADGQLALVTSAGHARVWRLPPDGPAPFSFGANSWVGAMVSEASGKLLVATVSVAGASQLEVRETPGLSQCGRAIPVTADLLEKPAPVVASDRVVAFLRGGTLLVGDLAKGTALTKIPFLKDSAPAKNLPSLTLELSPNGTSVLAASDSSFVVVSLDTGKAGATHGFPVRMGLVKWHGDAVETEAADGTDHFQFDAKTGSRLGNKLITKQTARVGGSYAGEPIAPLSSLPDQIRSSQSKLAWTPETKTYKVQESLVPASPVSGGRAVPTVFFKTLETLSADSAASKKSVDVLSPQLGIRIEQSSDSFRVFDRESNAPITPALPCPNLGRVQIIGENAWLRTSTGEVFTMRLDADLRGLDDLREIARAAAMHEETPGGSLAPLSAADARVLWKKQRAKSDLKDLQLQP